MIVSRGGGVTAPATVSRFRLSAPTALLGMGSLRTIKNHAATITTRAIRTKGQIEVRFGSILICAIGYLMRNVDRAARR